MELVYLWVEDYKNIHEQGFNFSPQFHCEYNEEENELTINKNDDYIPDFFGKNINITAIVGKNGSGKSSVLKIIREIIDKKANDGSFLIFYEKTNNKYIGIYTSKKINVNIELEQSKIISDDILCPMFDYSLTYDSSINFQNEQLPVYPNKSKSLFSLEELITNQKNIIYNYNNLKDKKQLDKFKDFFQPHKISITLRCQELIDSLQMSKNEICQKTGWDLLQNLNDIFILRKRDLSKNIEELRVNRDFRLEPKKVSSKINKKIEELRNEIENQQNFLESEVGELCSLYAIDIENILELKNIFKKNLINNIETNLDFFEDDYRFCEFLINDLEIEEVEELMKIVDDKYFFIDLISSDGKKLSSLSFGEQQLIKILNQLYIFNRTDSKNYIILLDEIDIGFHPDWQKRIIQYIIDFLSLIPDKNFYLIFTTHSPFLLSDIPKKNILFLNDEPSVKQTFGANIHTLLSDSFFMEDGLMGEFAKSKIDDVINYLHDRESKIKSDDEAQKLIHIIGEPIVKNQLQRMLDSKRLEKVDEIEVIKESMMAMQKRLDELEK